MHSFRYDYSSEFLLWALDPPNANPNFIFGFRSESTNELMGFISGIPTTTQANERIFRAVLINFFCVHKELRSKRLAPILMKEMGRRVAPSGISQAIYEAGVVLPDPVASTRNHHRPLNPKKLIQVGFSQLGSNHRMTIERMQKVYKLPNEPITPRLRPMNVSDVEGVHKLVTSYLEQYSLKILFTMDEIRHWFLPRDKIMYSYVVDNNINGNNDENDCNKTITDFISFYHLPSSILHHADTSLYGAYSYYNVATTVPIEQLMQDALILAKNSGADVFNALDIMNNNQFFETLKFDISDGNLHYYIYNWTCKNMSPDQVGLVLL